MSNSDGLREGIGIGIQMEFPKKMCPGQGEPLKDSAKRYTSYVERVGLDTFVTVRSITPTPIQSSSQPDRASQSENRESGQR